MLQLIWFVASAALTLCALAGDRPERREQVTGKVLQRATTVPPVEMTPLRAEELGREFLAGPAAKKQLAKLSLSTNVFDFLKLEFHGHPAGGDYDYTNALAELKSGYPFRGPVARVLKLGRWAVLDYRGDATHFTEKVLEGTRDEAALSAGGSRYAVLDFELTGTNAFFLDVYLRSTSGLSAGDAASIARRLFEELAPGMLTAHFRTDTWFLEANYFPLLFPFTPDIPVPQAYQYLGRPDLSCKVEFGSRVACSGRNFQP
ncbi:MAG TPA: hypothetical protein VKG25_16615 [Bryobacteraceae bacterium]|nr:hypothetical protein [Bryobacteraceae bacterium]